MNAGHLVLFDAEENWTVTLGFYCQHTVVHQPSDRWATQNVARQLHLIAERKLISVGMWKFDLRFDRSPNKIKMASTLRVLADADPLRIRMRPWPVASNPQPVAMSRMLGATRSLFPNHMQRRWVVLTNKLQKIGIWKQRVAVWLRPFGLVCFGVIDGHAQVHVAEIDAFESLGHKQRIRGRVGPHINRPNPVIETRGINHELITFPASDGIAHPGGRELVDISREFPSIGEDLTPE
jgi:hypothetical protein